MSLKTQYERFLASPSAAALSDTASLHYVTTLTSFGKPGPIVKHLETQNKDIVKKKTEKVITAVEGQGSIALEVETTLEFISHGGSYLPGLDNFIVDHIATLSVTHFVSFDRDGKISQIRLSWDQGSLLKQVDIIGARGRNWPITDGPHQIKLIAQSISSAAANTPATPPRGRNDDAKQAVDRSFSPSKKYIKDPHASLNLYETPPDAESQRSSFPNPVAPRESAKPPPREYTELFAAGHEDLQPSPGGSPQKTYRENVPPPKGAGSRKFESSNLFGENQQAPKEVKIYKTNPARYNHFSIGEEDELDPFQHRTGGTAPPPKTTSLATRTNKNQSQWGFGDEEIQPAKTQIHAGNKARRDADTHFDFQDSGTPNHPPAQAKPRKDAETHFDIKDDITPAPRRIIARTKAAGSLYVDNILGHNEDEDEDGHSAPLATITNKANRRNNDVHWSNNDNAPIEAKSNGQQRKGMAQEKSFWDF